MIHSAARDVFKNLARRDKEASQWLFNWLPGQLVCDPDLVLFAESFMFLLAERERADYDHMWTPTKKDAEDAINWAEDAIDSLNERNQTLRCKYELYLWPSSLIRGIGNE